MNDAKAIQVTEHIERRVCGSSTEMTGSKYSTNQPIWSFDATANWVTVYYRGEKGVVLTWNDFDRLVEHIETARDTLRKGRELPGLEI